MTVPAGELRRRGRVRSAGFAAAFAVAVLLGRATILDGANLSLIWPAGGVAAAWFCLQRHAGTLRLDVVLLSLTTLVLNLATGAGPVLAAGFVAANLVQVLVFRDLLGRWCPALWGGGGQGSLDTVRDLVRILAAAGTAALAGCALGTLAVAASGGEPSVLQVGVWAMRNAAGILLVVAVVLRVGRRPATGRSRRVGEVVGTRRGELLAALGVSAVVYTGVYGVVGGLPLGFLPLAVTVWVALRFDTTVVALHNVTLATTAVLFTLAGRGPLAAVADEATRALVVQADITLIGVVGLALALGRDERDSSLARARASAAEAERRGRLADAVLASVDVGIVVTDPEGRLVIVNDTARSWHGLGAGDLPPYEILRADGVTPLPVEERPLHRSRVEGAVSGIEFVIVVEGRPPVPVLGSGRSMTAQDGSPLGVVVALHELTSVRAREAELAAANSRLAAHAAQVERLAHASRAVLTADDPRRAICEAALDIAAADATYLLQPVREADGVVRLVSTSTVGLPEGTVLRLDPLRDKSVVLTAFREERQVFVADVPAHPDANPAFVRACGTVSAAWQPVVAGDGEVVGILAVVWRRRVEQLETTTAAVLTSLAAESAHAFARADLMTRLSRAADHDPLTGLLNRRRWDTTAQAEIARAARSRTPLTFVLLDLDHFKAYNDTHGHLAGDELLRGFAAAATGQLREVDTLARWGGEEFVLALPGCCAVDALVVVDRIRAVVPRGQTCTAGLAEWRPGMDAEEVLRRADQALYRGKDSGRDTSVIAPADHSVGAGRR